MSERIGSVSLGNMGRAWAESLLKAGYELRVDNRNPRKAQPLVARGVPGDDPD
jgi:3-hydroxyisobutyrate dehydrogenase-like beta-hydroxyacid dehydrogenase